MSFAKIFPNKTFIIFLYGFPGSGKTAFGRQLAEEINVAHLQYDRLMHELYGSAVSADSEKKSRSAMNFMCREFLRAGVSVVYDANIYRKAERRVLRDAARKSKAIPVLIWLQIDPDTAFMRGQKRDRRKSDDHYAKPLKNDEFRTFINRMQNPDNEDYVVISGKHTFHTQKAAVFKKFYELGILSPAQLSKNRAKPELVNLVPQNPVSGRGDIIRRNINIR